MSSDFIERVQAISRAYSDQLDAAKLFAAAWSKTLMNEVRPVFKLTRDSMSSKNVSLSIQDEGDDGIVLVLMTIPVGKSGSKKLSYRPNAHSEVIVKTVELDGQTERQQIPLATISRDLIEGHVEDFLKNALRIKSLSGGQ